MKLSPQTQPTHNPWGVDLTLLQERLKLAATDRVLEHQRFMNFIESLQNAKVKHDRLSKTHRNLDPKPS